VVKKELKKKILIFGSSGFLGSQFVKFIKKKILTFTQLIK
jgi:nucleoside-diphosphate-sugar epimerase